MKRSSDAAYSNWLIAGIGMLVGGFLLGAMMVIAGSGSRSIVLVAMAGLFFLVSFAGLVVLVVTLSAGLRSTSRSTKAAPLRLDAARIQARYAINSLGETIFDESYLDFEDPKTKLYVRISAPGMNGSEFKCQAPVWTRCGEGMEGTAVIQGDWLGQFFPKIAGPSQGDPYRRESGAPN